MNTPEVVRKTKLEEGRYVYCIVNSSDEFRMENIGIENAKVYTISHKDIAAVVHACPSQPYQSKDANTVMGWFSSHCDVIDKATKHFGTVLPFSFDAIVKGDDATIKDWLGKNYEKLKQEIERLRDKAEYTVQIFCDHDQLMEKILDENRALRELKDKIGEKTERSAYLLHRKFELKVKDAHNAMRVKLTEEFTSKIRENVDELKVEKKISRLPEKYMDKKLIVTFSCLVHKDKAKSLGQTLGKIKDNEGYTVRFIGPWAPFSFVRFEEI